MVDAYSSSGTRHSAMLGDAAYVFHKPGQNRLAEMRSL
jgi:hypothetical protein